MVSGTWEDYSAYTSFTLAGPKAGFWKSSSLEFYVTTNRSNVAKFAIYVYGCGVSRITYTQLVPIVNNRFSFRRSSGSSSFFANGTFSDVEKASGTVGLKAYYIPGCGNISHTWSWTATWQNASRPTLTGPDEIESIIVMPIPDDSSSIFTVEPVNP